MSSVLPPELIHMVMSYLSDKEKMRLIRIDPGTFDVLTSDERFKAEFNTRSYYLVKVQADRRSVWYSRFSCEVDYIVDFVVKSFIGFSQMNFILEVGRKIFNKIECRDEDLLRLKKVQIDAIEKLYYRVVHLSNLYDQNRSDFDGLAFYNSVNLCSLKNRSQTTEIRVQTVELLKLIKDCFTDATLEEVPYITELVNLALAPGNKYMDDCVITVGKMSMKNEMQLACGVIYDLDYDDDSDDEYYYYSSEN